MVLEHNFSGTEEQLLAHTRAMADRHMRAICDEQGRFLPDTKVEFVWPDAPELNRTFEPHNEEDRVFPALAPDNPAIGTECGVCDEPFVAGDVTMLIPKERPRLGQTLVEAALCHERCVREYSLPTHCAHCGCLLKGGATQHASECPWSKLIEHFDSLLRVQ